MSLIAVFMKDLDLGEDKAGEVRLGLQNQLANLTSLTPLTSRPRPNKNIKFVVVRSSIYVPTSSLIHKSRCLVNDEMSTYSQRCSVCRRCIIWKLTLTFHFSRPLMHLKTCYNPCDVFWKKIHHVIMGGLIWTQQKLQWLRRSVQLSRLHTKRCSVRDSS